MSLASEKGYFSADSCGLLLGNEKSLRRGIISATILKRSESQRKNKVFI